MDALLESLKKFGIMRLAVMGSVVAALVGFFIMISSRISEPDMALLYADLDPADGGQIVSRLETMSIPIELRGGGTQIYVPSDKVARVRMEMAEAGLPSGGSIGYEIFDRSDVLGSTSFVQDINRVRALEGELSRSIRTITNVSSARVHLVIPKRELFSRDFQQPSASVVLRMRGGRLTPSQVVAVQHLVAAGVAGLSPGHISIIDERGTLLSRGEDGDDGALVHGLEEAKQGYENRMARTVEALLERSLGAGKVRAEVNVVLDRNRTTENSELYDPDGQVVRSSQSTEESGQSNEAAGTGGATVTANIPGGQAAGSDGNSSETTRTDEIVNYEISKTIRSNVKEAGAISRVSVAVLVDGTYTTAEDGTKTYAPRPQEELDQLTRLVRSAVGYDEERGDKLEVINMQFAEPAEFEFTDATDWFMGFSRHDVMRFVESVVLAVIALLALLFGVRPIVNRLLTSQGGGIPGMQPALAGVEGASAEQMAALSGPEGASATGTGAQALPGATDPMAQLTARRSSPQPLTEDDLVFSEGFEGTLERKNIVGRMKASSVEKIESLIDQRTNEAVAHVRGWLGDEGE